MIPRIQRQTLTVDSKATVVKGDHQYVAYLLEQARLKLEEARKYLDHLIVDWKGRVWEEE